MIKKACLYGTALMAMLCVASAPALAQTPPNAGTLLQELRKTPAAGPRAELPEVQVTPAPRPALEAPGELRVLVRQLRITGATAFTEAQLLPLLQDAVGQELPLERLEALATRVSRHYRKNGYTVARAYLPEQDVQDGVIELAVIEGRFGAITVKGGDAAMRAALPLGALRVGDVVTDPPLERTLLLINDQPGVTGRATLQPGAGVGTSELVVEVEPGPRLIGAVELDNSGGRSTGHARLGGNVAIASPAGLGDQLSLRALSSGQGLAYGRAAWQLPVGNNGGVAGAAVSHMVYELGREFAALDASGTADTFSLFGSYPVLRSRSANLNVQASLEARQLKDELGSVATGARRRAAVLSLGLSGDQADSLLGGGLTSFSASLSLGRLRLEGAALAADAATARTDGGYGKASLALHRLHNLDASTALYLSLQAQWASKNLDSSEKLALGGPSAVRAYPAGESPSDRAQLFAAELRRALGARWQLIGFIDLGHGTPNLLRWATATGPASRTLRGAGLGLSWAGDNWSVRALYAHRLGGDEATAEPDQGGRFWLQAARSF
jgi:hemolysin activation/secretion protein